MRRRARFGAVVLAVGVMLAEGCESGGVKGDDAGREQPRSLAAEPTEIRGTVNSRSWVLIPAGTVLIVQLVDERRADARAGVISEQVINQPRSVPVPYVLTFDPTQITPSGRYTVRARVEVNGRVRWISTSTRPVLTGTAPGSRGQPVDVWVEPIGGR